MISCFSKEAVYPICVQVYIMYEGSPTGEPSLTENCLELDLHFCRNCISDFRKRIFPFFSETSGSSEEKGFILGLWRLVWNKSGLDWIQDNSWTILWVYKGLLPTSWLLTNFLPFLTSVKWHCVRPLLELTKAPRYANRRSLSEPKDPGQVIAHRPEDTELSRDESLRKFEAVLDTVSGQREKQKSTAPKNQ